MASYVKLVVFSLGEQEYGVEIESINGIERYQPVVPVPNSISFIKGIINVRDEVVPVLDLRKKFNMPPYGGDETERKMIFVRFSDMYLALEVDAISEVNDFSTDHIVPLPGIICNEETRLFKSVASCNGRLIVMVDVKRLLSDEELKGIKKLKEDLK
ncbi:MAG: chemotaxis protein CheW [Lachnospiraceae bacterium]